MTAVSGQITIQVLFFLYLTPPLHVLIQLALSKTNKNGGEQQLQWVSAETRLFHICCVEKLLITANWKEHTKYFFSNLQFECHTNYIILLHMHLNLLV